MRIAADVIIRLRATLSLQAAEIPTVHKTVALT
jgi:hypothetical protein